MRYTEFLEENRKQATLTLFSELIEGKDFDKVTANVYEEYKRNNRIFVRPDGLIEVSD